MNANLEKYFKKNFAGFYLARNGEYMLKGVDFPGDRTRTDKAIEQAKLPSVPWEYVYAHINNFLEIIRKENGYTDSNVQFKPIKLDGVPATIWDNGIVIEGTSKWESVWNRAEKKYDTLDKKYFEIKDKFDLERETDIIWLKMTTKGHVAVIAKGCDINWNSDNSSGKLVQAVGEELCPDLLFIFPITRQMTREKKNPKSWERKFSTAELELGVGNYLLDQGIPIIDYYSHMA